MSRSVWKGPFVDHSVWKTLLKKQEQLKTQSFLKENRSKSKNKLESNKPFIKKTQIMSRRSTILNQFVGITVLIHNGRKLFSQKIEKNMVGHKFGEFSYTRAKYAYKAKKKK